MCCTHLAGNTRPKKSLEIQDPKNGQKFTITTLLGYVFATKARIDNRKKLVRQQYSPTRPHNMVNFGPLADEIVSLVWGTPAIFNGSRILAALLHGILVLGVSETLQH